MTRASVLIATLLTAIPAQALAQECPSSATVLDCFQILRKGTADREAKSKTEQKPTGDAQATGTATSIYDFLPKAAAAAALPGLSDDFVGFTLARNFSLDNEYLLYLPVAVQVAGALRKPTVFKSILDTLPEERRPIVQQRLEESFDEFDDPELSLGLALETKLFGRRIEKHRLELANVTPEGAGQQLSAHLTRLQMLFDPATPGCTQQNNFNKPLRCFTESTQAKLIEALQAVVAAEADLAGKVTKWKNESGWSLLPDLINNKPQLTIRGAWRPADSAVGPQTAQLSAKWEVGFVNINATRRYCQRNGGYVDGKFTPDCFRQHVTSELNKKLLELGWRAFLEFDVKIDRAYDAPFIAEDNIVFRTPKTLNYTLTGGVGGNIPSSGDVQTGRIDLAFGHIWAEADGLRSDNRTWLSVTQALKLATKVSLLAGLEWADKAEFKNEPTNKLRANFGVRYKLITEEPEN